MPLPPHISKLPRWGDSIDDFVALVDAELLEWDRLDAMDSAGQVEEGIPPSAIFSWMEQDAIVAAKERGDFEPLAELLSSRPNPFVKMLRSMNLRVSAEAEDLIAKKLRGELTRKRGAPKKTPDERRANSPAIGAAEELPATMRILRHYRAGIKRKTLENYLRSDRRVR